jgi:hypothetical protein
LNSDNGSAAIGIDPAAGKQQGPPRLKQARKRGNSARKALHCRLKGLLMNLKTTGKEDDYRVSLLTDCDFWRFRDNNLRYGLPSVSFRVEEDDTLTLMTRERT